MALPVTITGISTAVAPVGPFKVAAGNYAQVAIDTQATPASGNNVYGGAGSDAAQGQSLTNGASSLTIASVVLNIYKAGTPTDDFYIEVTSTDPRGSVLATSYQISATTITATLVGSAQAITFTFASPPTISAGATFGVTIRRTGGRDVSNFIRIGAQASSSYAGGSTWTYDGTSWLAGSVDLKVVVNIAVTIAADYYYFFGRDGTTATTLQAYKSGAGATIYSIPSGYSGALTFGDNATRARSYQTFTTDADAQSITSIAFGLRKVGSPTDNLVVDIYLFDTGTSRPIGSSLGTSATLAGSGLTTAAVKYTLTFSTPVAVSPGTRYAVAVSRSGAIDTVNYYAAYSGATANFDAAQGSANYNSTTAVWGAVSTTDLDLLVVGTTAADPTVSWGSIATKTGFTTAILNIAAYQVGSVIHLLVNDGTASTSVATKYLSFDAATDTFLATTETVAAAAAVAGQMGATVFHSSLVVRSTGVVVALYNGLQTNTSGTPRARMYYATRSTAGVWTVGGSRVDANTATDNTNPEAILGVSDSVHFIFSEGVAFRQRTLSAANALQTVSAIAGNGPYAAVSYDDAGVTRCVSTYSGTGAVYFNSGNTPTLTASAVYSSVSTDPKGLFSDQGDVWVIYRNSSDSDLYAARSTTDGSTWLTPVNIFTATIASAAVNLSVDATIYQRGNNVVIPYIVNDAGTLKYNEYTVRTTTPPAAVLTALPGAVTLAGPSVKLARAHDFNVTAGAVALAGQNVTLRYGHKFQAGVKAFAVAGKPASLVPYGYLLDYPAGVAILQVGGTGGHQKVAQEITVPAGKRWTITDYTGKYETFGATDQIMMEIRQGAPDGALIATATNTGSTSTIQSSIWGGTWFSFRFNNPELDPGTYFFVISRTGALNDLAYWHVWFNYNNYSGGTAYSCVGGVWSLDYVAGIDLTTQVVGKESVFTSNKVLIAETGAVALAGQNVTLTKAGAIAYLRPDGDVATDGWTDQAGGTSNIYQSIDEATADDLDYVQSPDLVSTSLAVRLFEGSTQIATWSHPSPGTTFATAEQTLTGPEFAAIGNFSNLFVEFDDGSSNVYRAPLSNPPAGAAAPAILRYRYKKLVTGSATTTWNPSDKAPGITVDGTNLIVGSLGAGGYPGIRAIASHTGSGLYFCSIKMDAYTWPNAVVFGIANGTGSLLGSGSPFYSNNMMGMNVDGAVWLNGAQIGTSTGHYYANAVADMCVDIGLKLVWWRLDGGPWNANASNNPVTGVGGISYAGMAGDTGAIYPYIAVEATSSTVRTNFGATTYTYAKPAGASDW